MARIAAVTAASLVLVTAGAGAWLYHHLNGNLSTVSLAMGGKSVGGTEKADPFGRTPINLLVIGSDARSNAEDCRLGGACAGRSVGTTGYGNADVEMLVHISADRSNATVMSIPRDTVVQVPACVNDRTKAHVSGYLGMINSALGNGPACQVATIHQLTGIPIDHFAMVDFSGVVKMSDAVGGVQVCVNANVYDTYSHLKLKAGSHILTGQAALAFVRSRHGFGNGSDLGRTYAQHMYLSSLIRKLKSAGTLTNPAAMYSLADAATKALTVDDGLGSVAKLIGLAADLDKVPTKRITFTTMQTAPDPADPNRLVPGAAAQSLFAAIAGDQALTGGAPGASASASASASRTAAARPTAGAARGSRIAVRVENGSGVAGRAGQVVRALVAEGFGSGTTAANAPAATTTTTLGYATGHRADAVKVAAALDLPASHLREEQATRGLVLVIGSDWSGTTAFSAARPTSVSTRSALSNAHMETADQGSTCAEVSTYDTVQLNGVPMTPTQAYARATEVPDSAP